MRALTIAVSLFLLLAHVGHVHCWESFKKLSPEKREWLHRIAVKQGLHAPRHIKGARPKRQTCGGSGGGGGGGVPPPPVNCPHPGKPVNGAVSSESNSHPVNTVVTYSCNVGYRLVGNADNLCQAIGQWRNAAPTCVVVTCGFPGKPSNGAVSSGSSSHNYNARVTYSCDAGYTLVGSADNLCQNNGQWKNNAPTCRRITCSKPSLNSHVSVQPSRTSYDYGTRVVFSCAEGYNTQGSTSSTCGGTGQWNNPSPTCQAISCPSPSAPSNGKVQTSSGSRYRSVATYSCNTGYHLGGSTRRTCQVSGQWDGSQPTCTRISCPRLSAPSNGNINQNNNAGQGSAATYSCNNGYELNGNQRRTCTYSGNSAAGIWSGSTPSCSPVSCGQPTTPAHGTRSGNSFTFGSVVSFRCEHGHYLQGDESITCQANKAWAVTAQPRCLACQQNTYKSGTNSERNCAQCPANTHTTGQANSQVTQCICDHGFEGPNGGPCTVIKCQPLTPPPHGVIGACSLDYNNQCSVHCADGYVRHGGDETRTCLLSKQWSGSPPTCRACTKNTHKSGSTECSNCPLNSVTAGAGSSLTDCTCKPGFNGPAGGPCQDIDECASNNGGCEQICTNFPGIFECSCHNGHVKDATDHTKCIAKNSCPALDRPDNGGLVCVMRIETNTERCSVKCNAGYQHILRPNLYEECGPSTNFRWTTETNMTPVLGCMESFFDGLHIDGEAAYFTTSCDGITGDRLRQVQQAFIDMLQSRGICVSQAGQQACSVEDVTVECGTRGKRDVNGNEELKIKFRVKMAQVSKLETLCKSKCENTARVVLFDDCYSACEAEIEEQRKDLLEDVSTRIDTVLSTEETATGLSGVNAYAYSETNAHAREQVNKFDVTSLLRSGRSQLSAIMSTCEDGMEKRNSTCVPCPAGSYLSGSQSKCVLCPPNQFQPIARQDSCRPCPTGHRSSRGATECSQTVTDSDPDFFVVIGPKEE